MINSSTVLSEGAASVSRVAEIVFFHHARGLTPGCSSLADRWRAAGHVVHTPDLYEGRTFDSLDAGVAHAREIGFGDVLERGRTAAEGLSERLVYAGASLGVMPAQSLAQTRPGALGALLLHGAVSLDEFGDGTWPAGVPLQIHTMEDDDWGDVDVARELATQVDGAEVFLYPGDRHLFTDDSIEEFDPQAAELVVERSLDFLARIDAAGGRQAAG
jgi:dienelactone hydrolase